MQLKNVYWFFLGILHLQLSSSYPRSKDPLHYTAAVVEYHPVKGITETAAASNIDNYITILKKAKELNDFLDIIVYPETGILTESENEVFSSVEEKRNRLLSLAPTFPDISDKPIPCEMENSKVSSVLKKLSCAAKQYETYLVVNYIEKEDCKDCGGDKKNLYNSNIVFDRNGTVISRYRKYNLFQQYSFNVTSEPEISVFDTDFGVKFGQFICFDILFQTPALELLKKHKVTDIVYPVHWFSELPFLDASSVQAAWSYANDVTLLAAGFNNPSTGSTGSGIFTGKLRKNLGIVHAEKNQNVLLMATVPKAIDGRKHEFNPEDPFCLIQYKNIIFMNNIVYEFNNTEIPTIDDETIRSGFLTDFLPSFNTTLVQPKTEGNQVTLCKDNFCCDFNYKTKYNETISAEEKYYRYRFGVFNGGRLFGKEVRLKVHVCGLITCRNDSLSSCGIPLDKEDTIKFRTNFEKLEIKTLVPKGGNLLHLPISLQADFAPLDPEKFIFKSIDSKNFEELSLSHNGTATNLMTFGIYGRNFSADGSALATSYTKPKFFSN